jgi:hypothetical protein
MTTLAPLHRVTLGGDIPTGATAIGAARSRAARRSAAKS